MSHFEGNPYVWQSWVPIAVEKYQDLLEKYEKIVGIYCECSILIHSIKQNAELLHKQLAAFSFYNEHQEKATRDLAEESAAFLWFQLFKDVILRILQDSLAKQQLIQFCRQYYHENQKEFGFIDEIERSYSSDKSIRFLHSSLGNQVLIIQKIHFDPNDLVNRTNEHRHRQKPW